MVPGYAGRSEATNDGRKARDELGWEPTVGVMEYIAEFRKAHPRNR
jgi:hypothetical protein